MVTLKNKELNSFIMFKLGTTDNNFKKSDLKRIKELELNPIFIDGKYHPINIEELSYFPNLKYLVISNMHLDIASFAYITRLEKLYSIIFNSCTFEDLSILSNIKVEHVGFNNSKIENLGMINRINHLKELSLNGYNNMDLSYFFNLDLKSLDITNSTLLNSNDLSGLKKIEKLIIDNTNIMDLSFLNKLNGLKELYISKTQYMANNNIINNLNKEKVKIIIDKVFPLTGGDK